MTEPEPQPVTEPERVTQVEDEPAAVDGAPGAMLVIVSGPSGVGKDTVISSLVQVPVDPPRYFVVTCTTRPRREYEVDGVHYHFLTREQFERTVAEGGFLEWAEFAGNLYGTPRQPVLEQLAAGTPVLLEIDLQGARQVRVAMPDAALVFLAPPSWDELVRRLTGRGTEAPEVVERRLATAREELAAEEEFDETLVNTSVDAVVARLLTLLGAA